MTAIAPVMQHLWSVGGAACEIRSRRCPLQCRHRCSSSAIGEDLRTPPVSFPSLTYTLLALLSSYTIIRCCCASCVLRALLQLAVPISLMTSHDITYMFYGRFLIEKQIQQYYRNTPLTINNGSSPFLRFNSDLIRSTCVRFVIS